jgi:hypothetical protein
VQLLELSERKKYLKEQMNELETNAKKDILQTYIVADESLRMYITLTKVI